MVQAHKHQQYKEVRKLVSIQKSMILAIGIVIFVLVAFLSIFAFIGLLIGGIIGYFAYPRTEDIKRWFRDVM